MAPMIIPFHRRTMETLLPNSYFLCSLPLQMQNTSGSWREQLFCFVLRSIFVDIVPFWVSAEVSSSLYIYIRCREWIDFLSFCGNLFVRLCYWCSYPIVSYLPSPNRLVEINKSMIAQRSIKLLQRVKWLHRFFFYEF